MIKIRHNFWWMKVSFLDAIKILGIKFVLIYKRFYRRIKIMLKINKLTLMLLPTWIAFLVVTWLWGRFLEEPPSFMNLLWEYKADFFTSFIIVLFSSSLIGINKYKSALWVRNRYYNDLLNRCDEFLTYIYKKAGYKKGPHAVLLSRNRFDVFLKNINDFMDDSEETHTYIVKIKDLLSEIKKDKNYETFYLFDGANFDHANRYIEWILDTEFSLRDLDLLFELVHYFGDIWRIDIETRVKIDKILHEKYGYKDYDDRFLYEIYCCNDISVNPWQAIIDSSAYTI